MGSAVLAQLNSAREGIMLTEIQLPYGESLITAQIPAKNIAYVLDRQDTAGLADEREAITKSPVSYTHLTLPTN